MTVPPNVFFRQRPTKLSADEAAGRLRGVLPPGVEASVEGGDVLLSWEDGPSASTVAERVAEVVNWELRGRTQPPGRPGPGVLVARRFSPEALAVAVVRFRASSVRPYDSSDPAAVAKLSELLDIDDPARSGYPVPDAMAALLLEAPDPPDLDLPDDASPAERLARKLTALGYDTLWNRAWSSVT